LAGHLAGFVDTLHVGATRKAALLSQGRIASNVSQSVPRVRTAKGDYGATRVPLHSHGAKHGLAEGHGFDGHDAIAIKVGELVDYCVAIRHDS